MRAILILLLLSACAVEPDAACRLEKLAELPITLQSNVPVLQVEINGQAAAMVLDTGADATVLTRVAARRLGIAEGPQRRTVGAAGGPASVGVGRLDRLALGPVVLTGVQALLSDGPRPPLDGTVGIDSLVGFEVELDVPRRRLKLYRARTCAPALPAWTGPYVRLPVQQQSGSGHLFVAVAVDGQTLRGLLDSGASHSVISLQTAQDIGIGRRLLERLPGVRSQAVNEGGVAVRLAQVRELKVGPDALERPLLAIADLPPFAGDLLIGGDYLGTRRVWFSFALGRVYVAPAVP